MPWFIYILVYLWIFVSEFVVFEFYVCLGCYSCLLDVRLGLSHKFEVFVGHRLFSHRFYSPLWSCLINWFFFIYPSVFFSLWRYCFSIISSASACSSAHGRYLCMLVRQLWGCSILWSHHWCHFFRLYINAFLLTILLCLVQYIWEIAWKKKVWSGRKH